MSTVLSAHDAFLIANSVIASAYPIDRKIGNISNWIREAARRGETEVDYVLSQVSIETLDEVVNALTDLGYKVNTDYRPSYLSSNSHNITIFWGV